MTIPKALPPGVNHHTATRLVEKQMTTIADVAIGQQTFSTQAGNTGQAVDKFTRPQRKLRLRLKLRRADDIGLCRSLRRFYKGLGDCHDGVRLKFRSGGGFHFFAFPADCKGFPFRRQGFGSFA
jgi:hypothetical protein